LFESGYRILKNGNSDAKEPWLYIYYTHMQKPSRIVTNFGEGKGAMREAVNFLRVILDGIG